MGVEQTRDLDFTAPADGSVLRETRIGPARVTYSVSSLDRDVVHIAVLRTPRAHRGQGAATAALANVVATADRTGKRLNLGASPLDRSTSMARLIALYRRFGFLPSGRPFNAAGDPEMVREPSSLAPEDDSCAVHCP